jgi:hypothetical protein
MGKMLAVLIDDAHLMPVEYLCRLRLLFEEFPKNHGLVLFSQAKMLLTRPSEPRKSRPASIWSTKPSFNPTGAMLTNCSEQSHARMRDERTTTAEPQPKCFLSSPPVTSPHDFMPGDRSPVPPSIERNWIGPSSPHFAPSLLCVRQLRGSEGNRFNPFSREGAKTQSSSSSRFLLFRSIPSQACRVLDSLAVPVRCRD